MRWFLCFLLLWCPIAQAETLRMAVTTSFHNSGLADVLLPQIAVDTGLDVQLLVVGTGQAIKLGRAGDVDAILVHSEAAEIEFIDYKSGLYRKKLMYNDFVLVGPKTDPAGISKARSAADALMRISEAGADFVSRGDDSGTHQAEKALWADRSPTGPWYKSVGAGMGAALNTAAGLGAYILTDRASWLNFGNPGDLTLLYEGDAALFNQYSFIPINPDLHKHVRADAVKRLENWLISPRAEQLINSYRLQDQQLFFFNAGK